MNISKAVGVITAGIPIVGILVGGIAFGLNFKTDVQNIKEDVSNQQTINEDIEERFNALNVAPYDDTLLWLQADTVNERIDNINIPEVYDDFYLDERIQNLALQVTALRTELDGLDIQDMEAFDDSALRGRLAELEGQLNALSNIDMTSDGSIDILDVLSIVQIIMNNDFPDIDDYLYDNMDVNDDTIIDIIDLIALINLILSN